MKKIKILGGGCKKCNDLADITKKAADEIGLKYDIEKVTDMQKIVEYGVMITPALVIDEEVVVSGKVPSVKEIKKYLQ